MWPGGGLGPPSPLGLYAALFQPAVECILNLQGLFKSEVPVVIFLHLVLKIKERFYSFVWA